MRPIKWEVTDSGRARGFTVAMLGYIPDFVWEDSPLSAAKQIDLAYQRFGGWRPFKGFRFDPEDFSITYPGDPVFRPMAEATLHGEESNFGEYPMERLFFYPGSWIGILQTDGSFEVAKVD